MVKHEDAVKLANAAYDAALEHGGDEAASAAYLAVMQTWRKMYQANKEPQPVMVIEVIKLPER